jgi:hypothetical protein
MSTARRFPGDIETLHAYCELITMCAQVKKSSNTMTRESLRNNKTVHTVSPNEGEHHKMNKQKMEENKTEKKEK